MTRATKAASKKKATTKATAKKAVAKKATAKTAPAKKAVAKKATATKATAKKVVAKKATAKKATAKKATARRGAAAQATPAAAPKVEFAPRTGSVAPTIPIPVRLVERAPTLDERASSIATRIAAQSEKFRSDYNRNLEMSWIYHDNLLDATVYTPEELTTAFRSDEVTVVDSNVMPIYDAIRRHREAIAFIRSAATDARVTPTVELLKKIYIVLRPEDGDPRNVRYRSEIPQNRTYPHEYSPPDRIIQEVRQAIDWVNARQTQKEVGVLRMATKVHYDLLRTFPFTHHSGKIARLFMNFLLMRGGYPPAIIHAAERQRYYEAVRAPSPSALVKMLQDSVENAISSIEKLLDEHDAHRHNFSG